MSVQKSEADFCIEALDEDKDGKIGFVDYITFAATLKLRTNNAVSTWPITGNGKIKHVFRKIDKPADIFNINISWDNGSDTTPCMIKKIINNLISNGIIFSVTKITAITVIRIASVTTSAYFVSSVITSSNENVKKNFVYGVFHY